jgi:hypothetical protein
LLVAYTGVRPSALLEVAREESLEDAKPGSDKAFCLPKSHQDAEPDALRYRDLKTYKVRGPDNGHIFIIVIRLSLMKGQRNIGLSYVSIFATRQLTLTMLFRPKFVF